MKVFVILLLSAICVHGRVTPDYFPVCKRSDPQVDKCVLDAIEAMRPQLKVGIPEVDIPPLDPFTVPTLKLDRTAPNLRLKATVKNGRAYGGENFKIEKFKLNLNNKYAAEIKMTLPRLSVTADYDVRGSKILTLDISGKGKLAGNFTGITVIAKGIAKPTAKDGMEFLQIEKIVTKVRINNAQIAVDDTQRPVAATSAASFFNASPQVVLDILNPLIDETAAAVIKAFVNKVLAKIPINEVLTEKKYPKIYYVGIQETESKMWSFLCLVGVISVAAGSKSFINFGGFVCPREEKALGRCLRDALNTYIPQLATGVPEYGVPPCEPLLVPSLSIQQSTGPISVVSNYSDVTVTGPASMKVREVHVNSADHKVIARLYIPELKMRGNYKLSGQLLMLPIEGDGDFAAKYGDIDALVTIVLGRQHRHNDEDALTCEHLDVSFHVGYASMQLDNLFGDGDGELSNAMNQFLNENWQKLAEELQTPMEEALRDFLKPLADHAFGTLNADDILSK
ncbi:uncharacterized protein LOC142986231 [Anticarsia gemmatalis]|uniref:uncharacterized protein LOC142986231 n=1 Tax=Anticarsia gemmatalis TaxID=129554 RepID=UPI003F76266E